MRARCSICFVFLRLAGRHENGEQHPHSAGVCASVLWSSEPGGRAQLLSSRGTHWHDHQARDHLQDRCQEREGLRTCHASQVAARSVTNLVKTTVRLVLFLDYLLECSIITFSISFIINIIICRGVILNFIHL